MAPRRRNFRRRGRAPPPSLIYEFSYIMNVSTSGQRTVTFSQLGIDSAHPSRVYRVTVNACCASGSVAALQIGIYGPRISTGESLRSVAARSRAIALGATARTISVVVPRTTDFDSPASDDIAFLLLCSAAQPSTGSITHIMVVGECVVQYQRRSVTLDITIKSPDDDDPPSPGLSSPTGSGMVVL